MTDYTYHMNALERDTRLPSDLTARQRFQAWTARDPDLTLGMAIFAPLTGGILGVFGFVTDPKVAACTLAFSTASSIGASAYAIFHTQALKSASAPDNARNHQLTHQAAHLDRIANEKERHGLETTAIAELRQTAHDIRMTRALGHYSHADDTGEILASPRIIL